MCVEHIPSPCSNARNKVEYIYTGPTDTKLVQDMFNCDAEVTYLARIQINALLLLFQ